ncbi:hypothetical protein BZG36_03127, partial [Bifiguratus adelaidae]
MAFTWKSTAEDVANAYGIDLKGKVAIVTGPNSGIGLETSRVLAMYQAKVIIPCRTMAKAEGAIEEIKKTVPKADLIPMQLDLGDLSSVRAFAQAFLDLNLPLHILINNAGIMGCPKSYTKDGFEAQFGVNHLGHFLLTSLLSDRLKASAPSRVVIISATGAKFWCPASGIDFDDLQAEKSYQSFKRYGQSKLANILHAKELQRRFDAALTPKVQMGMIDMICATRYLREAIFGDTSHLKNIAQDLSRWRLRVKEGAQTWHYLTEEEAKTWPQTAADRYFLGLPSDAPELPKAKTPIEAAKNGFEFYKRIQTEDGHWAGEYGGPMFLVPGLIISYYITGTPVPDHERLEIIRYLLNRAHPDDGGWGLHIEGHSTVFITTLTYVALRILGLGADHPALIKARGTLHRMGGATGAPAWGKFWLCAMCLYEWEGMNPVPPELWVLPKFLPIHPSKWWVQNRMVYLPMGYIYAKKLRPEPTDFIHDLRREIYVQPYESIDWNAQRNSIAKEDLYTPHTKLMDFINEILVYYMKVPLSVNKLCQYALDATVDLIRMEDENTFFLDIGPVNKVLNWLVCFYHYGKGSREFKEHGRRNADFMWLGPEGMMMNGTNGSQLWDTAFVAQACCEAGFAHEAKNIPAMRKTLEFLDDCQIKRNIPDMDKCYRHVSLGAWPFSTRDQGYTVSDCTAEGLKSVLQLQKLSQMPKLFNDDRLKQAVD